MNNMSSLHQYNILKLLICSSSGLKLSRHSTLVGQGHQYSPSVMLTKILDYVYAAFIWLWSNCIFLIFVQLSVSDIWIKRASDGITLQDLSQIKIFFWTLKCFSIPAQDIQLVLGLKYLVIISVLCEEIVFRRSEATGFESLIHDISLRAESEVWRTCGFSVECRIPCKIPCWKQVVLLIRLKEYCTFQKYTVIETGIIMWCRTTATPISWEILGSCEIVWETKETLVYHHG